MSASGADKTPIFVEEDNFYQIPYESFGKYAIMIRAYDLAQNYIEEKSILTIVSPLLDYTENGIRLKGLFLPWWLVWLFLLMILAVSGFAAYKLVQQKSLPEKLKKEVSEAEKEIRDVQEMEQRIQNMRSLEEEARRESERLAEKLKQNDNESKI